MATRKPSKPKKPRELTLFFESQEDCAASRDALGQSRRRPSDLDKGRSGSYSNITGHYGQVTRGSNMYRVPIRFKLIVDASAFETLTWEQKNALRHVAGDDTYWIAR